VDKSDVLEPALATREDASPAHEARKPTDADRFVGQRLRQGRRELGLTQEALAALLGVTFQQIQKYEAGHSRMSAGRLLEIAVALGKPIGWFYEPFEIAPAADGGRGRDLQAHDLKRDARRLVEEIGDIPSLQAAVRVLEALALNPR
jgi:transcriptional regulator with XRE-family HTH domain